MEPEPSVPVVPTVAEPNQQVNSVPGDWITIGSEEGDEEQWSARVKVIEDGKYCWNWDEKHNRFTNCGTEE